MKVTSNNIKNYLLSFAVGNFRHTSWPRPSFGQLFAHTLYLAYGVSNNISKELSHMLHLDVQ